MIHLTRLNNQQLVVNADLIKFIENAPDTVITLLTGEKLLVRESVDEVLERIGKFTRAVLSARGRRGCCLIRRCQAKNRLASQRCQSKRFEQRKFLKGSKGSVDKGSVVGVFVALGGILLGLALEGGKIGQILQPTAALIVLGGTLGAVMLQFPLPVVIAAFASLAQVFFESGDDPLDVVKEMVRVRPKGPKGGIVSLDNELSKSSGAFPEENADAGGGRIRAGRSAKHHGDGIG